MTKQSPINNFQIIRHRGQANTAQLPDGTVVRREEQLWVDEFGTFLKVLYDPDHFIYAVPKHLITADYRGPSYMCTCGGAGIYVGMSGYVFGASPQGLVFTCHLLATFQQHSNTGTKWV